jgi:hypothetical protein
MFLPDFAMITGTSVMKIDVVRFQSIPKTVTGRRQRPGPGETDPLRPFLFNDERVLETSRDELLTIHRLNSNTFIYEYDGLVVDSSPWREKGRTLLPFYSALFLGVLHSGKYSRRRLERVGSAMERRGLALSGVCQRLLTPGGGDFPVGGLALVPGEDDGGRRRASKGHSGKGPRSRSHSAGRYSPGRWREWCVALPSGGSRGGKVGSKPDGGIIATLGLTRKELSAEVPALGFLGDVLGGAGGGGGSPDGAPLSTEKDKGTGRGHPGVVTRLEEVEYAFIQATDGIRRAKVEPVEELYKSLSSFMGGLRPNVEAHASSSVDVLGKMGLRGHKAVRAAALCACYRAAFMAGASNALERLRKPEGEPFVHLVDILRAEFFIHVLDLLTEELLEAGGEYGKELTPHLLLCGTSSFAHVHRDSRSIFREFLERARRYVRNMEVRNTLAAVRGPLEASVTGASIEYAAGAEAGTTLEIHNPTRDVVKVCAAIALSEGGISILEPEATPVEDLQLLPIMEVPPKGRSSMELTFFIPAGESPGDARATLVVMPGERELLSEVGGAGTATEASD